MRGITVIYKMDKNPETVLGAMRKFTLIYKMDNSPAADVVERSYRSVRFPSQS